MSRRLRTDRDNLIRTRLSAGATLQQVGNELGVTRERVRQIANRMGMTPDERRMYKHGRRIGRRSRDSHGYVFVFLPDHPRANRKGYVREHIVIAEQVIGRALRPDESVHHKNGIRDDNRPENLEVLTKAEHVRHHTQKYSRSVLIWILRWVAIQCGRTPRNLDLCPPVTTVTLWPVFYTYFQSSAHAAIAADLLPNGVGARGAFVQPLTPEFQKRYAFLRRYTSEELLEAAGAKTAHEKANADRAS